MTLPNLDDEKIVNLYNRANKLRLANEFDKAYATYESILELDNEQVEAHWGLILCKYGVEYVDDPRTKKKIPTCHRAHYESILVDPDYLYVKEKAYGEALKIYEAEAKKINHIQKGILDISSKEDSYDIFICYKETDKDGERTEDSVLAQDIYDTLTKEGYKVFFSRITLEDKLGTEYEPYIFAALNSAKVMLVVGTSSENMESVWVKNEWGRYLEFMKKDKSKFLIPVYKNIDAYDLPDNFSMLQAQSMDKIGAMQDLVRGINKLISASKNVKQDELDTGIAKVQNLLDGATSLGNNRYEVTVVKERRASWYIPFVIVLLISFVIFKICVFSHSSFDFEISSFARIFFGYSKYELYSISQSLMIFQIIALILVIVSGILKIRSRKTIKIGNYLLFVVLLLEFLTLEGTAKYLWIPSICSWISIVLTFVLLFVNPKWQLDTSTKTIVDDEEKDKISLRNKYIRENFKKKEPCHYNKKIFFGTLVLGIIVYVVSLYNSIFGNHSNLRDDKKSQIEIVVPFVNIMKNNSGYHDTPRVGIVKQGEIYTILGAYASVRSDDECGLWYKIQKSNRVTGYVCNDSSIKRLFSISNERDTSVNQLEVINDYIRIRESASRYSYALGQVSKGEIYTILEDFKEYDGTHWYKIKTGDGITGYIYSGDYNEYVKIYKAEK